MIDYLPDPSSQFVGFLYSIGIGFALGIFYEVLRLIFFVASGSDKKFTLARDIIFLLFCLGVTFFFLMIRYNGKVMFYAVGGELLGGYIMLKLVNPFFTFLIKKKMRRLRREIVKIVNGVRLTILKFGRKLYKSGKNVIKTEKNLQKGLHNRHDIVYNQSVTVRPPDKKGNRGD